MPWATHAALNSGQGFSCLCRGDQANLPAAKCVEARTMAGVVLGLVDLR